MFKNKFVLAILVIVPFVVVVAVTLYLAGVRKYGTPSAYRQHQTELAQAREDSLRALEPTKTSVTNSDTTSSANTASSVNTAGPVNAAGSAKTAVPVQAGAVVSAAQPNAADLKTIQASLDSLEKVRKELDAREQTVAAREQALAQSISQFQSENTIKLAALYDNMRTALAVPIFVSMNDTLAVSILSQMSARNAASLLGAIAGADVSKATRLNNLLIKEGSSQ